MSSRYLHKPLRSLRQACCDVSAVHPELKSGDCNVCRNKEICASAESNEYAARRSRRCADRSAYASLNMSCRSGPTCSSMKSASDSGSS